MILDRFYDKIELLCKKEIFMVLPHFQSNLAKYAELLIAKGVNVQKGHTLVISIAVDQVELAHLLTSFAYQYGAAEVIVDYVDD